MAVTVSANFEMYATALAKKAKEHYDAFVKEGFTEDQAIELTGALMLREEGQ